MPETATPPPVPPLALDRPSELWEVLEREFIQLHGKPGDDEQSVYAEPKVPSYRRFSWRRDWLLAKYELELMRVRAKAGLPPNEAEAMRWRDEERTAGALLSEEDRRNFAPKEIFDAPAWEEQVQREEPAAVQGRMEAALRSEYHGLILRALYSEIHRLPAGTHSALCISGGGIRSATFGLGVLQGLARHKYLGQFTYLSTVSGGGYIGSWLSAWLRNTCRDQPPERHAALREEVFQKLGWMPGNAGVAPPVSTEPHAMWTDRELPAEAAEEARQTTEKQRAATTQFFANPVQPEPKPIEHLRQYSNYLTPTLGYFSADSWTVAATVLRNLFLNWLVIVPALLACFLVPRFLALAITFDAQQCWPDRSLVWGEVLQVGACVLGAVAATIGLMHLIKGPFKAVPPAQGQTRFLWRAVLPLFLAGTLFNLAWAWSVQYPVCEPLLPAWPPSVWGAVIGIAVALVGQSLCGPVHTRAASRDLERAEGRPPSTGKKALLLLSHASATLLVCALTGFSFGWCADTFLDQARDHAREEKTEEVAAKRARWAETIEARKKAEQVWETDTRENAVGRSFLALKTATVLQPFKADEKKAEDEYQAIARKNLDDRVVFQENLVRFSACGGTSFFFILLFVFFSILQGLLSRRMPDDRREWYARANGWAFMAGVGWLLLSGLVLWGPSGLHRLWVANKGWTGLLGALSGLITIAGGTSVASPSTDGEKKKGGSTAVYLQLALKFAAPVFTALLIVLASGLTTLLLQKLTLSFHPVLVEFGAGWDKHEEWLRLTDARVLWAVLAGLIAMVLLMSPHINVNRFSLNAMYRNRLIRAYLGASRGRDRRRPDAFTGFDPEDNFPMHHLEGQRPFHVINMALNLTGGSELAWQERQAESFTATPLACGSPRLGYRPATEYAKGQDGVPLTIGTAVSISGAAANPNHGYNSSKPVAFLMTLFNARLGAWLGNTGPSGKVSHKLEGPRIAVAHLAKEALGLTNSESQFINLSDGGHFDNLGLYEMILRRCRFIFISDAGCDPAHHFEDLANAISKVRVDLGIPIIFKGEIPIYPRNQEAKKRPADECERRYAVLGQIVYGAVDLKSDGQPVESGTLVYLKPAICQGEPVDVYHYAQENETFPHETTADQWFSESQFESYRILGFHMVHHVCTREPKEPAAGVGPAPASLAELEAKVKLHADEF